MNLASQNDLNETLNKNHLPYSGNYETSTSQNSMKRSIDLCTQPYNYSENYKNQNFPQSTRSNSTNKGLNSLSSISSSKLDENQLGNLPRSMSNQIDSLTGLFANQPNASRSNLHQSNHTFIATSNHSNLPISFQQVIECLFF